MFECPGFWPLSCICCHSFLLPCPHETERPWVERGRGYISICSRLTSLCLGRAVSLVSVVVSPIGVAKEWWGLCVLWVSTANSGRK